MQGLAFKTFVLEYEDRVINSLRACALGNFKATLNVFFFLQGFGGLQMYQASLGKF